MDLSQYIREWAIKFLKNKDIIHKKIISIENSADNPENFKINYKDKTLICISKENICNLGFLQASNKEENIWITTINSRENFDSLAKNRIFLIAYKNLTICFINPFSISDTKWIVKPYVHNLVSDTNSLEIGLRAMFDTVEETGIGAFKSRI